MAIWSCNLYLLRSQIQRFSSWLSTWYQNLESRHPTWSSIHLLVNCIPLRFEVWVWASLLTLEASGFAAFHSSIIWSEIPPSCILFYIRTYTVQLLCSVLLVQLGLSTCGSSSSVVLTATITSYDCYHHGHHGRQNFASFHGWIVLSSRCFHPFIFPLV